MALKQIWNIQFCLKVERQLYVILSDSLPMKKLIQSIRNQPLVLDPEKVTRGQSRRRRDPKRRLLVVLKTEQTETEKQLQTMGIGPNFSTLQNFARPLKKMSLVESESNYNSLVPQSHSYLANKFKKYVQRNNERSQCNSSHRSFNSPDLASKITLNSISNNSHVICASCCKVSEKASFHGDCLLINAREKMLRLLELRKAQENQYRQLSQQIKQSCLKAQKAKRSLPGTIAMVGLKGEGWEKEWKNSFSLELKRYRSRVISKSQKHHRNNMSKFILNEK